MPERLATWIGTTDRAVTFAEEMASDSTSKTTLLIAFGSNLGDSLGFIQAAMDRIELWAHFLATSRPLRSAPMYIESQPDYINSCAIAETDLGPLEALRRFKQIESELGRLPRQKNGPREIDIDLISYGCLKYQFGTEVIVPHPKVVERRFVLAPLQEIAPDYWLPGLGQVQNLYNETNAQADSVNWIADATFSISS